MPAVSRKQRNLMQAAKHGADFPAAKAIRRSMSRADIAKYADTTDKQIAKAKGPIRNVADMKSSR